MGSTFNADPEEQAYVILNLLTTVIGAAASFFTILLIYRMKVTTGHVLLVLTMSYFQFFYDITFFFSNVNVGYYITVVANFFQLSCGIAGSLVSNWIAFIALYIILYRRKFNIFENYYYIVASCIIPGIVDVIIFLIAVIPEQHQNDDLLNLSVLEFYYYARLISIFFNFLFVFIAFYKINLMSSTTINKSPQEIAIRTLTRRLIFYPIVQAIGRSGYAWYEFEYGVEIDADDPSTQQYVCLIFLTIVTPLVSVGYLLIFLAMQPRAYEEFKLMISCAAYHSPTKESLNSKRSEDRPNSVLSSHRLTTDTMSYYTDGGRESNVSSDKTGTQEIELSMAEVQRTSGGTHVAKSLHGFSKFEDEELINFIVDSEKYARNSESTERGTFSVNTHGSHPNRTTTSPDVPPSTSNANFLYRASSLLSGSIKSTVSGGNTLLPFRSQSESRARPASDSNALGSSTTENPLRNEANKSKRRSVNVLNTIEEGKERSANNSREPLSSPKIRGKSKDSTKPRLNSTDSTSTSTSTTKSVASSDIPSRDNLLKKPTVLSSAPSNSPSQDSMLKKQVSNKPVAASRQVKAHRDTGGYGPDVGLYSRESDFLADARESVDAWYNNAYSDEEDED